MVLLCEPEQLAGVGGVTPSVPGFGIFELGAAKFKAKAEIEFEFEGQTVVDQCRFDEATLIGSFRPELLTKTAMVGGAAFAGVLSVITFSTGVFTGLTTSLSLKLADDAAGCSRLTDAAR